MLVEVCRKKENGKCEWDNINYGCDFQHDKVCCLKKGEAFCRYYNEGLEFSFEDSSKFEGVEDLHLIEAIFDYEDYIVVYKRNKTEKYGKCNGKYKKFFKVGY